MLKKYLAEFKSAAVRELENGKDINELAGELSVNVSALYCWWHKSRQSTARRDLR